MPTRLAFAEHEPTSKAWRGVGGSRSLQLLGRSAGGANRTQKDRFKQGINPQALHHRANHLEGGEISWRKTVRTVVGAA
ncbi:Uncharacterised protein [Mobiluncus curtisii subsp. curtisii]|nr:Uncharacterised protein [Mobiluncus curtisii subsp. curtisii]